MIFSPKEALGLCTERLPSNDGYTYTLTTLLGVFLREAESRYGPRDRAWTPLGIEFYGDIPHLWFPGNCGNVSIMLTDTARLDQRQAIFQLAHETVHLLAPTGGAHASVFEEGLATLFSHEMSPLHGGYNISTHALYLLAEAQARQFLAIDPDGVRKIRSVQPSFQEFTPEMICEFCPSVPISLAESLCQPFVR